MSINSWSTITLNNYEDKVKDCQKHGPLRLKLALHLSSILNNSALVWFLDTGTLMGAYRDGKMLKHDDDFDIGIYTTQKKFDDLFNFIEQHLDPKYKIRRIKTYTVKYEVYDSSYGYYMFGENDQYDYHNVTIDLQLYLPKENGEVVTTYMKDNYNKFVNFTEEMIVPTKIIIYEGHNFNCPNNSKKYLEEHYGYIGPNAIYNQETKKYQPK